MQELEITDKRLVAVWRLLTWRFFLSGTFIGILAGQFVGFFDSAAGLSSEAIRTTSLIVKIAAYLALFLVVVRMALKKRYGDFRLVLVPSS